MSARKQPAAIAALAADPFPRGARKLGGAPGRWRLGAGGWRLVYTVEADRLLVLVLLIGRRGDVYERLKRLGVRVRHSYKVKLY